MQTDYTMISWPSHGRGVGTVVGPHVPTDWRRAKSESGGAYQLVASQGIVEYTPFVDALEIKESPISIQIKSALQSVLATSIGESFTAREIESRTARQIAEQIVRLERKVDELADQLSCRPVASATTLHDLGTDEMTIVQPVQIVIERYDDEVTASWPEIEAFGSGSSASEAILALKKDITALYEDLTATPDERLGILPLSWKRTLRRVIAWNGTNER